MGPDVIWGSAGYFQQLIFLTAALTVWAVTALLSALNPVRFSSVILWRERVAELFRLEHGGSYFFYALVWAVLLSVLFLLLELLIALFRREDPLRRLSRNDHLLPVNRKQRWMAAGIIIIGAFSEELLFRAFLFRSLENLWDHWFWAALLVSAVFALVHTNMQGLSASLWIFITSLLLVTVIVTTRSILYAVMLHAALNAVNIFLIPPVTRRWIE